MSPRRLYFDTGVDNRLVDSRESAEVRRLLCSERSEVIVSEVNCVELLRTPDHDRRRELIGALIELGSAPEALPQALEHTSELVSVLRTHRPGWLEDFAAVRFAQVVERARAEMEPAYRRLISIPALMASLISDVSGSVGRMRASQRDRRAFHQKVGPGATLTVRGLDNETQELVEAMEPAELWWRINTLFAWYQALGPKIPMVEQYTLWAAPFVRIARDSAAAWSARWNDWARLWLTEVASVEVPLNRLAGLTEYRQTCLQVTSGNAFDVAHTRYLLDVDVFLTTDSALHNLLEVLAADYPCAGRPHLIRTSGSLIQQIYAVLSRA